MLQNGQKLWTVDRSAAVFCTPGAVKEKDGIRFTAAAGKGQEAVLLLYDRKSGGLLQEETFPQEAAVGKLRTMKINGLPWRKVAYQFKIDGEIVCDPYAALLDRRQESSGGCQGSSGGQQELSNGWQEFSDGQQDVRCEMAFSSYDWKQDRRPDIAYEDAVMYHLHVRNYTKHAKSRVRGRGTFKGLQEKIPYLKELGINQVKLMPVYEPAVPARRQDRRKPPYAMYDLPVKENCWGYGPGSYFAPRRSYAATPDPVKEFKDMVRAFHAEGMEVLLDMYFVPETPVRLILDCLVFWMREYHIDGFHIMGKEEAGRYLAGDALLEGTKLIVSDVSGWWNENTACCRSFGESNDGFLVDMRRILKGDEGMLEAFAWRNRRNAENYAIINYMTNHDGFTLQDLVSYDNRHNEENGEQNMDGAACNFSWNCGVEGPSKKKAVVSLRKKQMRNAFLLMLLSQGTPMLLAGDEFCNSQGGNNNPYCLDNPVSWVDWSAYSKNQDMVEFVKKAVAFRKEHKILHLAKELQMADYKACGYPDLSYHSSRAWYGGFEYGSRHLGMLFCGTYAGEEEYLYVAYNFHPLAREFALPTLPAGFAWYLVADTDREEGFLQEGEKISRKDRTKVFPARTVTVLLGRREGGS